MTRSPSSRGLPLSLPDCRTRGDRGAQQRRREQAAIDARAAADAEAAEAIAQRREHFLARAAGETRVTVPISGASSRCARRRASSGMRGAASSSDSTSAPTGAKPMSAPDCSARAARAARDDSARRRCRGDSARCRCRPRPRGRRCRRRPSVALPGWAASRTSDVGALARQVIGGAGAEDAGADDDARTACLLCRSPLGGALLGGAFFAGLRRPLAACRSTALNGEVDPARSRSSSSSMASGSIQKKPVIVRLLCTIARRAGPGRGGFGVLLADREQDLRRPSCSRRGCGR